MRGHVAGYGIGAAAAEWTGLQAIDVTAHAVRAGVITGGEPGQRL